MSYVLNSQLIYKVNHTNKLYLSIIVMLIYYIYYEKSLMFATDLLNRHLTIADTSGGLVTVRSIVSNLSININTQLCDALSKILC